MRRFFLFRLCAVAALSIILSGVVMAGQPLVSTMRNVSAVASARGFTLAPAPEFGGTKHPGDEAPSQAFEIIRPNGERVTIGRLYTSCTCVTLSSPARQFEAGERAILELRNVRATPPSGQRYAIYVQLTSPIRTTLRIDTFVQSDRFKPAPAPEPIVAAADPIPADSAALAADTAATAAAAATEEVTAQAAESVAAADQAALDAAAIAREVLEELAETTSEPAAAAALVPAETLEESRERTVEQTDALLGTDTAAIAADTAATAAAPVAAPEPVAPNPSFIRDPGVPPQAISLITIGVKDLARSVQFYRDLGWAPIQRESFDHIAFFQLNGQVLCLYPLEDLLREQNMASARPVPGGITLALHVIDPKEVDAIYQTFIKAGATSLKAPTTMPSGAVTAYVADPEGNAWEISCVSHFRVNEKGELWLP